MTYYVSLNFYLLRQIYCLICYNILCIILYIIIAGSISQSLKYLWLYALDISQIFHDSLCGWRNLLFFIWVFLLLVSELLVLHFTCRRGKQNKTKTKTQTPQKKTPSLWKLPIQRIMASKKAEKSIHCHCIYWTKLSTECHSEFCLKKKKKRLQCGKNKKCVQEAHLWDCVPWKIIKYIIWVVSWFLAIPHYV